MSTPQFQHDCDHCHFLGHHEGHDLYVCQSAHPTVIARYGDDGSEYLSGLPAVGHEPLLTEAARLAVAAGLLDPNLKTGSVERLTVAQVLERTQ